MIPPWATTVICVSKRSSKNMIFDFLLINMIYPITLQYLFLIMIDFYNDPFNFLNLTRFFNLLVSFILFSDQYLFIYKCKSFICLVVIFYIIAKDLLFFWYRPNMERIPIFFLNGRDFSVSLISKKPIKFIQRSRSFYKPFRIFNLWKTNLQLDKI